MKKYFPYILAIALIAALVSVGYFVLRPKPAPPAPPAPEAPKEEKIDTSNWKTYRSEVMGFEIKYPEGWGVRFEDIGPQPFLEDEFWREQVGQVEFIDLDKSLTNRAKFNVRVKDAELPFEEMAEEAGVFGESVNFNLSGLPVKRVIYDASMGFHSYQESVLVKNDNRYFVIDFIASDTKRERDVKIWQEILSTFKPINE